MHRIHQRLRERMEEAKKRIAERSEENIATREDFAAVIDNVESKLQEGGTLICNQLEASNLVLPRTKSMWNQVLRELDGQLGVPHTTPTKAAISRAARILVERGLASSELLAQLQRSGSQSILPEESKLIAGVEDKSLRVIFKKS